MSASLALLAPLVLAAVPASASAPHPAWIEPFLRTARKGGPVFVAGVLFVIVTLLVAVGLLFVFLHITVARYPSTTSRTSLGRSAAVVVLGDVGRSPRMCLHAQSLAEDGWRVALVGYINTALPAPLRRSSVKQHNVSNPFSMLIERLPRSGGLFGLVAAPLKLIGQSTSLFWILATQVRPPPELIVVQTPPALPSLFVVRLVGMLLGTRIVIDWHNLGYSILAMRFPPQSPFVRAYRFLERYSGGRAFAHLCVTRALKHHLEQSWHVKGPIKVLYDRPPTHFRRARPSESHSLWSSLIPNLTPSIDSWCGVESDLRKGNSDGTSLPRADQPALVVSSTSWTADEDFDMLLRAASLYEQRARELNSRAEQLATPRYGAGTPMSQSSSAQSGLLDSPMMGDGDDPQKRSSLGWGDTAGRKHKLRRASSSLDELPRASRLPKMLLIVTGKGELRDHYLREIARLETQEDWQWVRIRTAWLPSEDYPVLLGSADVGVSLHSSSSGMDLPMKVVDMLGCGLPVCALGFPCINELVRHGSNGLVFYSEKELALQIESLLSRHPGRGWLTARTASMKTMFPEDIDDTPPVSAPASPSPISHEHNDSPGQRYSRTSSPIPMFTLIQSPALQAPDSFQALASEDLGIMSDESKARTWSRNWKRVVRPLIAEADEAEAAQERHARFAHLQTPARRAHQSSFTSALRFQNAGSAIAKARTSQDEGEGSTLFAQTRAGLALLDETGMHLEPLEASPSGSIFTRRHRRSNAGGEALENNHSTSSSLSHDSGLENSAKGTSSQARKQRSVGHLRQRTQKDTMYTSHQEADAEDRPDTLRTRRDPPSNSTIPGIHISAPPA